MTIRWKKVPQTTPAFVSAVAETFAAQKPMVDLFLPAYATAQPRQVALTTLQTLLSPEGQRRLRGTGPLTLTADETRLLKSEDWSAPVLLYMGTLPRPVIVFGEMELNLAAAVGSTAHIISVKLTAAATR